MVMTINKIRLIVNDGKVNTISEVKTIEKKCKKEVNELISEVTIEIGKTTKTIFIKLKILFVL